MYLREIMEEKEKVERKSASRKKRKPYLVIQILGIVFSLLFVTFCYAAFHLTKDLISNQKDKKGFNELSAIVAASSVDNQAPATALQYGEQTEQDTEVQADTSAVAAHDPATGKLVKYVQLSEMNPEFFGWINIEGLGVDYPVMYSPSRTEYYLNRDFYGNYSDSGIPFIDERCPADGNYYLLYGHLMKNKTVFGRLLEYDDINTWRANPVIRFDTLNEERKYAVMACFYSQIYYDNTPAFRYYDFYDLTDENVFNFFVEQSKANAIYETGINAEYGDELLVLSTCSHHVTDGRFAVVAKRIS